MTPQTQFIVSFLCVVAGHYVLWRWSDRLHRFTGAMLLTGAWLFGAGVGVDQLGNVQELLHSRAQAAEPGERMSEQPESIPQWTIPVDGGVLSFSGGDFPGEFQGPAKPNDSTSTNF